MKHYAGLDVSVKETASVLSMKAGNYAGNGRWSLTLKTLWPS